MEAKIFPMAPVSSSAAAGVVVSILFVIGIIFVIFGYLIYSMKHCRFELNDKGLQVKGEIYARFIPYSSMKLNEIKNLDFTIDKDSPYRPVFRTNGAALPGYQSGWFRLSNKEKALLFVSDRTKVIYIPTTEGFSLLLTPDNPQDFVETLKTAGHFQ
jgi:hypothetical protein